MKISSSPSPNFDERPMDTPIDILVLHYTGMKTAHAALERMCDPQAKVSAHYMIDEDGSITQLVAEDKRAWHAGVAYWRGQTNINARSIGIEIVNPGHEWGYRAFPTLQIDAVIQLSKDILARHPIPARNVVGHSDVAPRRKQDPGELFPWQKLAQNGVGLWLDSNNHQTNLLDLGYEDESTDSILAFQRHFTPNHLSGVLDDRTKQALSRICLT